MSQDAPRRGPSARPGSGPGLLTVLGPADQLRELLAVGARDPEAAPGKRGVLLLQELLHGHERPPGLRRHSDHTTEQRVPRRGGSTLLPVDAPAVTAKHRGVAPGGGRL